VAVVLGATDDPSRDSYKAIMSFQGEGYTVLPVNPMLDRIAGMPVVHCLEDVEGPVSILSVYVKYVSLFTAAIVRLRPRCVVFNSGVLSDHLEHVLRAEGIRFVRDCTLRLLADGGMERFLDKDVSSLLP